MFNSGNAQREISIIAGSTFAEIGRVGATAILGFGRSVSWPLKSRATEVSGSEYALHVQCPFRIVQGHRIILGSEDMKRIRRTGETEEVAYDRGAEAVEEILRSRPVTVHSVSVFPVGDLHLELDSSIRIEVFPASPSKEEAWRFLVRFGNHYIFPDGLARSLER
jgi:hypothetical protein